VATARTLRAKVAVDLQVDPRTIDTCGTGGDGAGTFNVSTTAAFVVAGAGLPVGKHGNRAASSRAGSIDVLEALGVNVDQAPESAARTLSEVGIASFFARRLYPAMRHVATVRKELGIRTLMNCMGPLLNPLRVRFQLTGVYARPLVESLAAALVELGIERALVVHGSDGMDEITTTGVTHAALVERGGIRAVTIDPSEFGIEPPQRDALLGGDATRNAEILRAVLAGERGARRDIVAINAAAALWVAGAAADLGEGMAAAARSIDSGAAREKLDALVRASAEAG
jgi:anthranilate phosphoribosyltransferase